jgi:hypothetical protein
MKTAIAFAIALSVFTLQFAVAKENYHEKTINADTKDAFATVVASVRDEMQDGGKYEFVQKKERAEIDAKFNDMTALFDQYGTVSAMTQDAKVRLFNDQEVVTRS